MSAQVIVADITDVQIWDSDAATLTNPRTHDFGSQIDAVAVSKDKERFAVGLADDTFAVYPFNHGDLGTAGSPVSISGGVTGLAFAKHDPELLAVGGNSEVAIYRIGSDLNATRLSAAPGLHAFAGLVIDWSADGSRLVCKDGANQEITLITWDGETAAAIASTAPGGVSSDAGLPRFASEGVVFVGNGSAANIYLYDVSGDAWALLDSQAFQAEFGDQKPSPDGTFVAAGRRDFEGPAKLFGISGNTFADLDDFPSQIRRPAWFSDNKTIAGAERGPSNNHVYLFSWDGAALTQTATTTAGIASSLVDVLVVEDSGPSTDKELFNASYAAASAADPKITALISPVAVQRSIDSDVSQLLKTSREFTLKAIVGIDDLDDYKPGTLFFVKDDQPGLRAGRKLLLKSYKAASANPAEPVTLIFRG